MSCIPLNLHSSAASVTLLPPPKFTVQEALLHFNPRGQARKESDQSFAVRFPRCEIAQHKCSILPDAASLAGAKEYLSRGFVASDAYLRIFHTHAGPMIATMGVLFYSVARASLPKSLAKTGV